MIFWCIIFRNGGQYTTFQNGTNFENSTTNERAKASVKEDLNIWTQKYFERNETFQMSFWSAFKALNLFLRKMQLASNRRH